jgi:hypothetical protein
MKYIFSLLLCFGFLLSTTSYGQEETKKVVIIKKVKDADGKTSTERQEATRKEADALIKKMKEDGTLEGIDIDIEVEKGKQDKVTKKSIKKEVSIEKTIKDGKEMNTYKIVTEENGEKKVMKWTGEGEMPAEMAEILKDEEIEIQVEEKNGEKRAYEIITEDDGEKKVMFWNGDGEMPAEMKKALKDVDIKTTRSKDGEHITIKVEMDDEGEHKEVHESHKMENRFIIKDSPNKVTLGVMIEDDSQGVVLSEIVDKSVAQKSGLKAGDTILKINDTYVFSTDMLLKALSVFDKGDSAKITFLRDGKEKKVKAKF